MKLSEMFINEARESMANYPKVSQLLLQHSEEERSFYDMARDLLKNPDFKAIIEMGEKIHEYSKTHKSNPASFEELIPKFNGVLLDLLDIYADEYTEQEFERRVKDVADVFVPLVKKEMAKSKGKKISGVNVSEGEE